MDSISSSGPAHAAQPASPLAQVGEVLLSQGAEARLYTSTFLGRPAVVKERFKKDYRLAVLDEKITKERLAAEARCIARCRRAGVDAPLLYFLDIPRARIVMERVHGITVKHWLWHARPEREEWESVARTAGTAVARIHAIGMVHGDLTTSNMMLRGYPHVQEAPADAGAAAPPAAAAAEVDEEEVEVDEEEGDGADDGDDDESEAMVAAAAGRKHAGDADADAEDGDGDAAMGGAAPSSAVPVPAPPPPASSWITLTVPTQLGGASTAAAASASASASPPGTVSCRLCLIDFGLAGMSATPEEKGVDLYVLERALLSTHTDIAARFFAELLAAYYAASPSQKDAQAIKGKFEQVRLRGRKRLAFG